MAMPPPNLLHTLQLCVCGHSLCLAHAVDTADGLLLGGHVEQRLSEQNVRCLDDVQPLGAGGEGEEEDGHLRTALEGSQTRLRRGA